MYWKTKQQPMVSGQVQRILEMKGTDSGGQVRNLLQILFGMKVNQTLDLVQTACNCTMGTVMRE